MKAATAAEIKTAAPPDIPEILHQSPLFAHVEFDRLAELATHCTLASTYRGETLMEEGAETLDLLLIVEGRVSVRVESISPFMEIVLTRLSVGEILGESLLLGEDVRYATVVSEQSGLVLRIPAVALLRLCDHYPAFGRAVMSNAAKILAARLRRTNQRLVSLLSRQHFGTNE